MLNYDKLSHIFSCLLLTCNHMIFLIQFGINKHLLRPQIALALWARTILLEKKIYSCSFIPNCTQDHVITYTNCTMFCSELYLFPNQCESCTKHNDQSDKQ